jgi:hypothetical protein
MEDQEPDGIAVLRAARGSERVTFGEVADHLHDLTHTRPTSTGIVDDLARFLARVEHRPHRHHDGTTRTEAGPSAAGV